MGVDTDQFVDGDRISRQLICSICSGVLENPVQTPCEHLFCEAELLEWLVHHSTCPLDNLDVDPTLIVKPSRIIMNMLNELTRYCPNREHGCDWTGESDLLAKHLEECEHVPKSELYRRLKQKDKKLDYYRRKLHDRDARIAALEAKVTIQAERLAAACIALDLNDEDGTGEAADGSGGGRSPPRRGDRDRDAGGKARHADDGDGDGDGDGDSDSDSGGGGSAGMEARRHETTNKGRPPDRPSLASTVDDDAVEAAKVAAKLALAGGSDDDEEDDDPDALKPRRAASGEGDWHVEDA